MKPLNVRVRDMATSAISMLFSINRRVIEPAAEGKSLSNDPCRLSTSAERL